ncbi:MAG: alpha/beta hydrolase [Candidatus Thermoplasmatota archaeon]|nr:alpha/beta hydrolase [Candidatus Thermoplasmatota archaeon]
MEKAALFIHGWAMDDRIFHRKWVRELGAPLFQLFSEEFGYTSVPLNLPGSYLKMDRDFDSYAGHILQWIADHPMYEEIVLVGHSMGAITVRRTILRLDNPDVERIKRKITRAILIGAPNHGTAQPLFNTISRVLTSIGHRLLPKHLSELTRARTSYLEETPCYRDLDPRGGFMHELNSSMEWPFWIKADNIWTLNDTVVEPAHSAILPGTRNHMIDTISVNHFNIPYRKETINKVRSIMKGTARPGGPQLFPPENACQMGGHHDWWPHDLLPVMERMTHWKCSFCGKIIITDTFPEPLGCEHGKILEGPHLWKRISRSYSFRYHCRKCGGETWHPDLPSCDTDATD